MCEIKVGLIGGTGLGEALMQQAEGTEFFPRTPFGRPSAPIICTEWEGLPIAILARHGPGHVYSPSRVPYRANIFALKQLGVTHIIASGACGSLRDDVHPGELVIPDQVIDKTYKRDNSFFGDGLVAHVEFDRPYCPKLGKILMSAAGEGSATVHAGGTYICMEGPQFSTVAESKLHRSWGAAVIGMTSIPEAKLAREAEICYALVALPTDYDCWKPHPTGRPKRMLLAEIMANMKRASAAATELIKATLKLMGGLDAAELDCPCRHSLELAIWTDRARIAPALVRELNPLLGKYFPDWRRPFSAVGWSVDVKCGR